MRLIVQHNESIVDMALRAYGASEGIVQLWADNGLASVDAEISPGDELLIDTEFAIEVSRQLISDREDKKVLRFPIVQKNQNIIDLALQEYGATEGFMPMIRDNGLLADQELAPGTELVVEVADMVKPLVVAYFRRNNITVATGLDFNDVTEVDLWIDELVNFVVDEGDNKIIV